MDLGRRPFGCKKAKPFPRPQLTLVAASSHALSRLLPKRPAEPGPPRSSGYIHRPTPPASPPPPALEEDAAIPFGAEILDECSYALGGRVQPGLSSAGFRQIVTHTTDARHK